MISRNRARSGDGREIAETVISKTVQKKKTQGNAKNTRKGPPKWKESVLEKWRGALVKARLALNKKREKKKERYAKSTLARLRKLADSARKKPGDKEKAANKKSPSEKKRRLPLEPKLRAVRKAQVFEEAATEGASTKIRRKAKATPGRSQADDGEHSLNGILRKAKATSGRSHADDGEHSLNGILRKAKATSGRSHADDGEHSLNGILRKAKATSGRSHEDDGEHSLNGILRKAKAKSRRSQADDGEHRLNGILRKAKAKSGRSQADDGEHSRNGEAIKLITKVKRGRKSCKSNAASDLKSIITVKKGRKSSTGNAASDLKSIITVKKGRKSSTSNAASDLKSIITVKRGRKSFPSSAATDLDEGLGAKVKAKMERKEEVKKKWRTSTDLDEGQAAKLNAEIERKEVVKNKWRSTLKLARLALQQKRERKKEQAQNVAIKRLRKCQYEGVVAPDHDIVQVGLSLKRPSLEELRNFAKKSRS